MVVIVLNRSEIIMAFVVFVQQIQLVHNSLSWPLNASLGHRGTSPQVYLKGKTYKWTGVNQGTRPIATPMPAIKDEGPNDSMPHQTEQQR